MKDVALKEQITNNAPEGKRMKNYIVGRILKVGHMVKLQIKHLAKSLKKEKFGLSILKVLFISSIMTEMYMTTMTL